LPANSIMQGLRLLPVTLVESGTSGHVTLYILFPWDYGTGKCFHQGEDKAFPPVSGSSSPVQSLTYSASFFLNISFTCAGFALPLAAFIT
jgi:hypothetical protein